MSPNESIDEDVGALCSHLNGIEGIEAVSSRAGNPEEGRFMGYVSMRAAGEGAVRRLLARLGRKFATVFHVGDQKCEMGFRVEVSVRQDELRYLLRFWGCPAWGMRRIRTVLTERVAGDRDRDALPSLEPPRSEAPE